MGERTCMVDGCDRPTQARGWCHAHYDRWRITGRVGSAEIRHWGSDPYERFMSHVDTSDGPDACHPWTGWKNARGYGMFNEGSGMRFAHRWLLGYLRDRPLESDECGLHRCDNPPCCNRDHLYVGNQSQNMRDMFDRGRANRKRPTHCPRGHPYDEANTYIRSTGARQCRACHCQAERMRRARHYLESHAQPALQQRISVRGDEPNE